MWVECVEGRVVYEVGGDGPVHVVDVGAMIGGRGSDSKVGEGRIGGSGT